MKRTLALFLALAMLLSTTASALAYMDGTGIPGNWPAPVACNHSYYLADTIINGCNSPVTYIYRCSRCGDTYREQGPAPGHDYRNQGSVAATCTSPGYDQYVCSRCGPWATIGAAGIRPRLLPAPRAARNSAPAPAAA